MDDISALYAVESGVTEHLNVTKKCLFSLVIAALLRYEI